MMTLSKRMLIVLACLAGVAVSTASAQESARLLFEVTIDGSTVARPEMKLRSGDEGRIQLDEKHGGALVNFTPTVRGDDIAIAFDIAVGDRQLRPRLVISKTVSGSIEWLSETQGQTVRLAVSWVE
jgi:hypothetical protein